MEWWVWITVGFVLIILELVTPAGFYLMFFGLGALTVGALERLNLLGLEWVEWLLFTVSSIAYILLFRDRLRRRAQPPEDRVDSMIGDLAVPKERIAPGAVGRVEVRGAQWNARNEGSSFIETGQRCRVTSVNGLLVSVQPE